MELKFLRIAFQKIDQLSFLAMGRTSPNPPVAAVILDSSGKIIAEGNTQISGNNHAEREAYLEFDQYSKLKGFEDGSEELKHEIFVSLEPCTHFGKTPPCRDLILEKKPEKLTMGWRDPNPLVSSGDWKLYHGAGILASLHPLLARTSYPYLFGFFQRIQNKRPWVWIKSAISEDGLYTSGKNENIRINDSQSNYYLQMLRAKFDAIVVGPNTLKIDEPSLNFRPDEMAFETKGKVENTKKPDAESFFAPGPGLLNSLLNAQSRETFLFHKENESSFQPWRVFILSPYQSLSKNFFLNQKALNEKYSRKLCLFYVIRNSKINRTLNEDTLKLISELSDSQAIALEFNNGALFLESLAHKGINTVLLEAGSFLWNFLKDYLVSEDCILTIRNQEKLLFGKKFEGEFNSNHSHVEYHVGEDTWKLNFLT